jgi:hypothetical protein
MFPREHGTLVVKKGSFGKKKKSGGQVVIVIPPVQDTESIVSGFLACHGREQCALPHSFLS